MIFSSRYAKSYLDAVSREKFQGLPGWADELNEIRDPDDSETLYEPGDLPTPLPSDKKSTSGGFKKVFLASSFRLIAER